MIHGFIFVVVLRSVVDVVDGRRRRLLAVVAAETRLVVAGTRTRRRKEGLKMKSNEL